MQCPITLLHFVQLYSNNGSTFCMYHEQKTSAPHSQFQSVMFWGYMFWKDLHDGTVTVEVDRLLEIPPSSEPPVDRIEKDSVSTSNTTITRKGLNTCLHLNCACTIPCLNVDLLCCLKMASCLQPCRIVASDNHCSCHFALKRAERGYYDESDVVLCVK